MSRRKCTFKRSNQTGENLYPSEGKSSVTATDVFCLIPGGGGANSLGTRNGKENRIQSSKQRKSKEEDKNKSSSSQIGNIASSLHELNARLEEQQRQERGRQSTNGSEARSSQGEGPDESVTHDTTCARSHASPANGHK